MALTEEQRLEIEKTLKEVELMSADDVLEDCVKGDYYSMMKQIRGQYYFTRERVVFMSGWGLETFGINYTDIRDIKKSTVGPFMPFGVTVSAEDKESGKVKKYKFSLMKRAQWIDYLAKKAGIA